MSDELYQIFARTPEEAAERAKNWRERDPFAKIPPALLSAEHIIAYVKQTGMIYPFHEEEKERLKAASYEIVAGGLAVRWEASKRKDIQIANVSEITFAANSITFMQTECRFRLPEYIALRFNLRIQHVHRGLLLGTGPLIDPGFGGDKGGELLIPVHNLTATDYTIPAASGFIWVEFTKTSRRAGEIDLLKNEDNPVEFQIPSGARDRPIWFYFEKANRNMPIESSIPGEILSAKNSARQSASSARKAERANKVFAGIGFLAVLAAAIGILSFIQSANMRIDNLYKTANDASQTSASLKQVQESADKRIGELQRKLDDLKTLVRPR